MMPGKDQYVVEKQLTLEESIRFEDFPVLNESSEILVLVDEPQRSGSGQLRYSVSFC
jgi:type I restriction enzyme, R subunit